SLLENSRWILLGSGGEFVNGNEALPVAGWEMTHSKKTIDTHPPRCDWLRSIGKDQVSISAPH
ncbi:MAG: hypothetical protein WCE56_12095, partial [Desulfobacterales bacterium]